MSVELVSILVLVLVFVIAAVTSAPMGALALVAAFVVGIGVAGETADDIFGGFPGDLFVILVGVTYLFALANSNGTVNWLVMASVRAVRGHVALIPWVMFTVTAVLTAVGAVVPAAVAIVLPVGMGFATRYRISPMLMSLLIINGGSAGGFSPISVFGGITNGVVERSGLDGSPVTLFVGSLAFNLVLSVVVFLLFGGRGLIGRRDTGDTQATADTPAGPHPPLTTERGLTLLGIAGMAIGALAFDLDVGLMAISVAVALTVVFPASATGVVNRVAWPTVLLICGIVTYVSLMERVGTVDYLGTSVAAIGVPLAAALVICLIGAAVSAFASTTGILGAIIPLAVPFLQDGQVGAVGMITALAISSSVVDSSPFSTNGALAVASAPEEARDRVFRQLMLWGMSMIAIASLASWGVLVVPGWL